LRIEEQEVLLKGGRVGKEERAGGGRWLVWLFLSRLALSLVSNAYAGVMPLVREEWGMTAAMAATIQIAWHVG